MIDTFDLVASKFDPYICKLLANPFTGEILRNIYEWESKQKAPSMRTIAVAAVDTYHGFTCEFSPWQAQHIFEYDILEEMLERAFPDGWVN